MAINRTATRQVRCAIYTRRSVGMPLADMAAERLCLPVITQR